MTDTDDLYGKLFYLTRADLDSARFRFPSPLSLTQDMTFVRVRSIAEFWTPSAGDRRNVALESCTRNLLSGLYGGTRAWTMLLKGSRGGIQCWFRVWASVGQDEISSLLAGAFPDIALIPGKPELEQDYAHGWAVSGTPGHEERPDDSSLPDEIEQLCRGIKEADWVFAVQGAPIPAAEVVGLLNRLTEAIKEARLRYLQTGSTVDERNRLAQRYVELLEHKLKRLEAGRVAGLWNIRSHLLVSHQPDASSGRALLHSAFNWPTSLPDPVRVHQCDKYQSDDITLEPLTSMEAAHLARFPRDEFPGYGVRPYTVFGYDSDEHDQRSGPSLLIGTFSDPGIRRSLPCAVARDSLTKHCLVAGITGSGKTNTCFDLLDQIWNDGAGVPFLVIEPAKSEYRRLVKHPHLKSLRVFTIGDETVAPLRLNPLEVPPGVLVQTHIDYLKSLFAAAFVLYPPMPYVLEESLHEIYADRGWDLASNTNARSAGTSARVFPVLRDLAAKISVVVDRMGYDSRLAMDVNAGLLARINQLRRGGGKGPMLDTRISTPNALLFEQPCILELKQTVSDDEKAFLIGLILIRLYQHVVTRRTATGGALQHVTLIEEAHRLLRRTTSETGSDVHANPRGQAIELFGNLLSEIRAFGEGIIIAEQIPVKLTPDVIKNSSLKIVHRLIAEDDRRIIGGTMNLSESQSAFLANLRPGEAVVHTEGKQKAVLVRIPLTRWKDKTGDISEVQLRELMALKGTGRPAGRIRCVRHADDANEGDSTALADSLQSDAGDHAIFLRLFNSLRLGNDVLQEALDDFVQTCHASRSRGCPACAFLTLLDAEAERRGTLMNWSHEQVDEFVLACRTALDEAQQSPPRRERSDSENRMPALNAFVGLANRLHRTSRLPYAGCVLCPRRCHYRCDLSLSDSHPASKDLQDKFFAKTSGTDEIAAICWDTTAFVLPFRDIRHRKQASLCLASQQMSRLGLSRRSQIAMVKEIVRALATTGDDS